MMPKLISRAFLPGALLFSLALPGFAPAQPAARRVGAVVDADRVMLPGSKHPLAAALPFVGHAAPETRLEGMTLYFKPSAAQQAALDALVKAQGDPSSPSFHQWLTPAQYEARFGMSAADIASVTDWLSKQGFQVTAGTGTHLTFSGTVAQVESAFGTTMNRYMQDGAPRLANTTELSLPSAIAGVTLGIRNISEFRPQPHLIRKPAARFTSSVSGNHFLAPADFATIYDLNTLYNAGFTGSGQIIAVVGESTIRTADIDAFRSAAGLTAKEPTLTLVPNSGTAVEVTADEQESDLDVEWSGAVAQGATINFVYVGNNQNYSTFDAIQYAVENKLAPIISSSYGACELNFTTAEALTLNATFEQANTQGQTIIAASGDTGAADCETTTGTATTITQATHGLAVDIPASSPFVTGIGGTEFAADSSAAGTYWNSGNSSSNGSVIKYIPEEGWNDTNLTSPANLAAGGGGLSILFGKPSWQTGTGVQADGARDVPDIALNASPNHDGYLYCNVGSCSNGFRDGSGNLTVAGGTSFGAPTFAGILALLNQKLGSSGLGNINPTLYALAASTPTAFHDLTTGNNQVPCAAGSTGCGSSGILGYTAGTGYDLVTGLGSVDANALAGAFAVQTAPTLLATTTSITPSTSSPVLNTAFTLTTTVGPNTGSVPTGTVQFAIDGTNVGSAQALGSSVAAQVSYSATLTTAGAHTITATYSGDSTHAGSVGTLTLTAAAASNGSASFALSATNVTVKQGSSGTSTITVTPAGGYTGTVTFTASSTAALTNACYSFNNATVTGTAASTATATFYTTAAACQSTGVKFASLRAPGGFGQTGNVAWAVLLLPFFSLPTARRGRWYAASTIALAGGLLMLAGCGSSTSTAPANAAKGTYALTVTGTDSTAKITETTTLMLTIQ